MGVFSEVDMDLQQGDAPFVSDDPFADPYESPAPVASLTTTPVEDAPVFEDDERQQAEADAAPAVLAQLNGQDEKDSDNAPCVEGKDIAEDDEDAKRKAHEESEAKRKAEWDAKQAAKKAALQEQLDRLAAMSDDEVMDASAQRIGADTERLTRRNMKECISEHIQTLCFSDATFARKVYHPRKSMIHCIWYINRKAKEFVDQEMKDNGYQAENGIYGCDVPDDLCYQWAEDYFNDPNAKEDEEREEKFTPYPYFSGKTSTKSKTKTKKEKVKKPVEKATAKPESDDAQMSLLGAAV